ISHNTTSWKSHTSTWRWTAGNDGRSPEGGKARRYGRHPALARQKAIGQHDQREVPMQAIPTAALVMIQTTLALGVFIKLLDRPAAVGQRDEAMEWGVRWQVAEVPFEVAAFARQGALAEQPALRSRADAVMAGRQLRAARSPVHAHSHELFAQDYVTVLAPGDGQPTVRWQPIQHHLGLIEWGGARFLGLATAPRAGREYERGGGHFVGQADPKAAADANHVSHLPGLKALHEGRIVAVAGVGDHPGKRDAPRSRLLHQGQGQFGLRLKRDLWGDMDFGPTGLSGSPGLWKIDLGGEGPMHGGAACGLIGHVVCADDDLAIGHLTQGAGVLAGHPDRATPLLGQSSVVEDQDALGRTLRDEGPHTLLV